MSGLRNPMVDRYLAQFREGLKGAPPEDREEFISEIDSHIAEAVARGEQIPQVLASLGPAERLAKSYRAELMLASRETNLPLRIAAVIGLVLTASIPSMIIIPLLLTMGLGFIAGGGAAIVVASIPSVDVDFYNLSNDVLNRVLGALTGLGLIAVGLLALWVLYLYVLLLVRATRGALHVGAPKTEGS
jgi:uncharacterized membrane protein